MIPGANILNMAMTIIAKQALRYYRYAGRMANSIGQDISLYNPPKTIYGSWQPVPRQLYQQYGLDLQKNYFTFYTSNNTQDIARDVSGDQLAFNGQRYQCESNNDWYKLDGWKGILCVHVGLDTSSTTIWGFNGQPPSSYVNFTRGNFIT